MASGRLMTTGKLTEMLAFQIAWLGSRGLERQRSAARVAGRARRQRRPLGDERYAIDLPLTVSPERVLAELAAGGATLVSLNPIRDTLEDLFVKQVTSAEVQSRDRGLGPGASSGSSLEKSA